MDKILRKAELSGAVVIGAGIQYPRTANVYIGDDKNGYERGDLVDANAVIDIVDNGDTQDQKDIKKLREDLTIVENKIPEEASSSNQLADKAYVNNGIATNSATFRGTYQSVSELDNVEADNNDYAFVVRTDAQGNSYYDRYKYVEGTGWQYEYTIENTQFSQEQLDAINSGATAAKIQKLDKLAAYDGEFVEVANLPTPSDATMGKVYMVPANPNVVINWDWENNIPSAIRTQWVEGNDATGTINSDITGIVLSVGPKVAGTYVKFSTNGGLDNVLVNTNTYVRIPIKDAGDTIHFVCVQNHHLFTIDGNAAQSDDFTYVASLLDKANGYVEVVSTGYCNFYRIVVTHTVVTRAAGMDPTRNTRDKYVTVLRGNAYMWEQIESTYINLDNFYTKDEVDGIASEVAQSAEQNLIDDERVIAFALNDLDQRIDTVDSVAGAALVDLDKKIENIPSYVLITWSELKQLRDSDKLIPGTFYRITDFVTTTAQDNTQSANHAFDIIVMADDTDVLNENAYAIQHSGDTYFSASTLEAWELKYCIDNDRTRFAWADDANGKGVIYYMKDEFENECPYDFKNIQFKRYQLKNQNSLHIADYPMGDRDYSGATQMAFNIWKEKLGTSMSSNNVAFYYIKGIYFDGYLVNGAEIYDYSSDYESYDNGNLIFDDSSEGNYVSVAYVYDYFDVIAEVENTNGEWFYTFSKKPTTSATATDASMDTDCYENFIKEYFNNGIQTLNDNIFIVVSNSMVVYGNSFDTNCYNNTFGNNCYNNTFGNSCYSNSFGNSCYSNSFGNDCNYNSFGNNCYRNTFGNNCYGNSFGYFFQFNSFGNGCGRNTFGNSCYGNSFGNDCNYNSFGNNYYRNTFGNDSNSNIFGNNCYSNSFGNEFQYNSFGNSCYSNSFGNDCNNITFAKDYMYYNIVENGNKYITVTSTQTTSPSNVIRNITIAQGVNNTDTLKTISHNTVNDTFKTTYQDSNSTVVNV